MSDWKAKRFWEKATVEAAGDGWTVHLDGRAVKTPGKTALIVPTQALAEAVAVEWDAQEGEIDPTSMPLTRACNSALDKVTPQHGAVADMLAEYGGTDLLCYRATGQEVLEKRQAEGWDPLLTWAHAQYGVRLNIGAGVMHVAQPDGTVDALGAPLHAADPFRLTGLHDLITISGSLIIALAVAEGEVSPDHGWHLSRLDEDFQIEEWGIDEEAAELAESKRAAFMDAYRLLTLL